ncbi:MAG: hypothetical protein R3C26_06360 [Calditrichia bacterium]
MIFLLRCLQQPDRLLSGIQKHTEQFIQHIMIVPGILQDYSAEFLSGKNAILERYPLTPPL